MSKIWNYHGNGVKRNTPKGQLILYCIIHADHICFYKDSVWFTKCSVITVLHTNVFRCFMNNNDKFESKLWKAYICHSYLCVCYVSKHNNFIHSFNFLHLSFIYSVFVLFLSVFLLSYNSSHWMMIALNVTKDLFLHISSCRSTLNDFILYGDITQVSAFGIWRYGFT